MAPGKSQSLAHVVDSMLGAADQAGCTVLPSYSADVQLVWPPCALLGQATTVEVRTEVVRTCLPRQLSEPEKPFAARLLTVRDDAVLGEELLKVEAVLTR